MTTHEQGSIIEQEAELRCGATMSVIWLILILYGALSVLFAILYIPKLMQTLWAFYRIPKKPVTKKRRISRPRSVRTGIFCKLGSVELMRPVRVSVWLKLE